MEFDLKHSFAPVADARTRVLVLGSLPGDASLRQARYYGHPRNLFWPLIGAVIGRDLVALDYANRLGALLEARVGLWDVVGSARRPGSLDAAIRDHAANDLASFTRTLPDLRVVGFNGGTAARIGRPMLAGLPFDLIDLPSSSPAYASLSLDAKRERWRDLAHYL